MHALGLALIPAGLVAVAGTAFLMRLLFRQRRVRWPVAHLHLWRELPRRPVRRVRALRELLLFAGAFLGCVAAAVDLRCGNETGSVSLVLLDGSPHMRRSYGQEEAGRSEGNPSEKTSRWQVAQRIAHRAAHALLGGPRVSGKVGVMLAGQRPRLLQAPTFDERLVHRAIDAESPDTEASGRTGRTENDARADLALNLARDLLGTQGGGGGRIYVVSDFAAPAWQDMIGGPSARATSTAAVAPLAPVADAAPVVMVPLPVGKASSAQLPDAALIRAEVGAAGASLIVDAFARDGHWQGRTIALRTDQQAPGSPALVRAFADAQGVFGRIRLDLAEVPGSNGKRPSRLELRLTRAGAPEADVAGEETLTVRVPPPRVLRVLRQGARDTFLDAALQSLAPAVQVVTMAPFDVLVAEGAQPNEAALPALLFAPSRDGPFRGEGEQQMVLLEDKPSPHPVMSGLSLADVNVGHLPIYRREPGDDLLVTAKNAPAIFVRARERQRWLVVAFAPGQSDFPLRPAFPLFIAQALQWLAPAPAATVTWGWPAPALENGPAADLAVLTDAAAAPAAASAASSLSRALVSSPAPPSWPLLAAAAALLSLVLAASLSRRAPPGASARERR